MDQAKEDRRKRRTRHLLRQAFLELLNEKKYEAITVQDVIERADVARSTFYTHYLDKEDLFVGRQGIFANNLNQGLTFAAHQAEASSAPLSNRFWFHHLQNQKYILQALAGDPALDLAMKTLRDMVYRDVSGRLKPYLPPGKDAPIPASVIVDYLVSALMVMIQWWLAHDMAYSPERMDEMFQQLVKPGLASVLDIRG